VDVFSVADALRNFLYSSRYDFPSDCECEITHCSVKVEVFLNATDFSSILHVHFARSVATE